MNKFLKTIALASLIFQVSLAHAVNRVTIADKTFTKIINTNAIESKTAELGAQITKDYPNNERPLIIVGVLGGATFFFANLLLNIKRPCFMHFLKVSSYSGLETTGAVTLQYDSLAGKNLEGFDVLIVEDIVESGTTMAWILNHFKAKNPASIKTASLLDKKDSRKVTIPNIDYVGFDLEKGAFVVGYGLDYDQHGRNLPGIYELVAAPAA